MWLGRLVLALVRLRRVVKRRNGGIAVVVVGVVRREKMWMRSGMRAGEFGYVELFSILDMRELKCLFGFFYAV